MNFKRNKPRKASSPDAWESDVRDKTVEEPEISDRLRTSKVEKPFIIEALYPPEGDSVESTWKQYKEFAGKNQRDAYLRTLQTRKKASYYSPGRKPFEYRAIDL